MIEIAIKNLSTVVGDSDLAHALPAFQRQVSEDFASAYGIDAKLEIVNRGEALRASQWQLVVFDDADGAGYLGYHDVSARGTPLGKVFAKTTRDYGGLWTVTFSHELLEMLADPTINLMAIDAQHKRAWSYEVCDAVEADEIGYKIDGIQVSDFVLPSYFEPDVLLPLSHRRSWCGHVQLPFELAPGGYMSFFDFATSSWQQIDAQRSPAHAGSGSRFARRQVPTEHRRVSTGV